MSGIEDSQDASEQDDTIQDETTETAEVSHEVVGTIEKSNSSDSLSEKSSTKGSEAEGEEIKKEGEEIKEKEQEEVKEAEARETLNHEEEETQREETSASVELATVTRSASSDDGVPVSGVATRQAELPGVGVPLATTVDDGDGSPQRRASGGASAAVGEWNSLPVLVERLREALELSLAAGCRRGGGDEPTATSHAAPGVGTDGIGDRSCARRCMEQALLGIDHGCDHNVPVSRKDELKFLEDLLLSDIQTALSRLRETLERTDVATLAKHGGVSDPTSKLHLLRLVSSLLSRLQVPVEEREPVSNESDKTVDVTTQGGGGGGGAPLGRRKRPVRHTIGVSAEEIARARRQLEENSTDLARLNDQVFPVERPEPLLPATRNAASDERPHVEEIHDKYTKDVINQRQSLRDKNKDTSVYRPLVPPQIDYVDRPTVASRTVDESNAYQIRQRDGIDSHQEKVTDDEEKETAIKRPSEEQSQVAKLAVALRQRAELISASKYNNGSNKFAAKKSKIKRANTIDIPSYLKLQSDSLGYNPGCAVLRRPINVGDKVTANAANLVVPSFQPKTENDKKFLALINRNNETKQVYNAAPAFVKSSGYTKATDMAQPNENWNSRFSNIKTAFDKSSSATNDIDKLSPRLQNVAKRFLDTPPASPQIPVNKKTSTGVNAAHNIPFVNANANANVSQPDPGFRHAPSSLFRKIEKPHTPKSPSSHWQKDNAPSSGNSLREKAKMFDRDSNKSQPFNVNENNQKSAFPRPPWIEHDRNEGKSNKMVTENGRLDYRQFCKQFAPFIGKNVAPEAKSITDSRKRNENSNAHRKNSTPLNEKIGVIDGKISFRMFPEKGPPEQYRLSESRRTGPVRDKFGLHKEKNIFEPLITVRNDKDSFGTSFAGNASIDAMLKGSSSVAVQTGINDDCHPEEARVFQVTPRVAKKPSSYNNVSVQTHNEPNVEVKEQWTPPQYNNIVPISDLNHHPSEDLSHFVLDHNRNYHPVTADVALRNEALPLANKNACDLVEKDTVCVPYLTEEVPFQAISSHQSPEPVFQTSPRCENYFSPKSMIDNRSQTYPTYIPYDKPNKNPFEYQMPSVSHEIGKQDPLRINNGALPEEQNIQNQDISADTGVVTRYTCAIATVASADVPALQVNEARPESGTSPILSPSSLSPSQFWLHPKLTDSETMTAEDEIRRHNMLQQNLIRQLQNERTILNDLHVNQSGNFNQPDNFHQSNFSQPLKSQSPETSRRLEPPKKMEPSRKLEPPTVVTGLLSVVPSGFEAKNRITALREQYEQPRGQSKPIRKERSPISNDASGAMDSSDEYLVSCTNKPSRSIVLSKSESWHQLALSKGHHSSSRAVQGNLPPQSFGNTGSYLPKPPKPKSPSSFKMKKQYEASTDSVKKMEDKIRRYFDNSANDSVAESKDIKGRRFSSRDSVKKGLVSLSRSRTMPGICDEGLHLTIPTESQIPVMNLNSADVDKVFDDIFEEATKTDNLRF
ncbi:uncharacterized protein LOC105839998 [Monomorium pharaonis]|uniref:uncharacterized protein LOC105839998 n=1 Tax=Monomorium pharaonis TaxID=307658 RepID=UPI0017479384|nr:uncharacterized protein LOC105839998 [Monomorium pharaonis]